MGWPFNWVTLPPPPHPRNSNINDGGAKKAMLPQHGLPPSTRGTAGFPLPFDFFITSLSNSLSHFTNIIFRFLLNSPYQHVSTDLRLFVVPSLATHDSLTFSLTLYFSDIISRLRNSTLFPSNLFFPHLTFLDLLAQLFVLAQFISRRHDHLSEYFLSYNSLTTNFSNIL